MTGIVHLIVSAVFVLSFENMNGGGVSEANVFFLQSVSVMYVVLFLMFFFIIMEVLIFVFFRWCCDMCDGSFFV